MKEKIIIFIVGLLLGAVMVTGAFCAYTITSNKCNNNIPMQSGNPPSMSGQTDNQNNGQPPEKPGDNTSQNSTTTEQNNN